MGVIGISSFRFKRRRNERFFSIIGGGDAAMLEIVGWRVDEDANGETCGRCTYGEWRADVLPTLQIDGKYFREQN